MDFCETHGLDLPCERCLHERHAEREYLKSIEDAMRNSAGEVSKDEN